MKKKLLVLALVLMCVFALVACGGEENQDDKPTGDQGTVTDGADGTDDNSSEAGVIGGSSTHRHTYSNVWSKDDTHHWHASTCEHDEKKDYAEHEWGEGEIILHANCNRLGEIKYTCTCGATKTEEIPKTSHTYSPEWSYDAEGHWHDYTCACEKGKNDSFGVHQLESEIIEPATESTPGTKRMTCKICTYSYTTASDYIPGSDVPEIIIDGDYYEDGEYGLCFYGGKLYYTLNREVIETFDYQISDGFIEMESIFTDNFSRYFKRDGNSISFGMWNYDADSSDMEVVYYSLYKTDADIIYKDYTGIILNGYYELTEDGYSGGFLFINDQMYLIRNREKCLGVVRYEIIEQMIVIDYGDQNEYWPISIGVDYIMIDGTRLSPADLSGGAFGEDYVSDGPLHEHVYADLWLGNDTHHWHNAICKHIDEIKDYGAHEWDEGAVTREATCANSGVFTYTCICGATKTESIPKLTEHTWDSGKVTKPANCAETGIFTYTCSVCEKRRIEEIPMKSEHDWIEGEITQPATCSESGVMEHICNECGVQKYVDIPKTEEHSYSTEWSSNSTHHWHEATCDCQYIGGMQDYEEHTFGGDNICTACSYKKKADPPIWGGLGGMSLSSQSMQGDFSYLATQCADFDIRY